MSRYYDSWYKPSKPKNVSGGIRAQSKKGSFASSWWGKRWIEVLKSFNLGARLTRGKNYARRGQVRSLDIEKGHVHAVVQGSRSGGYKVELELRSFSRKEWEKVIEKIAERPILSASLLANEMPEEMEDLFHDSGLFLFPRTRKDLQTRCSCPDDSNPCKHIAAVYYIMAEAFDRDPFMLFRLRGMEREKFLEALQGAMPPENLMEEDELCPMPLPDDPEIFWDDSLNFPPAVIVEGDSKIHGALPKRLGNIPFWRSDDNFLEVMKDNYRNASDRALLLQDKYFES